MFWTLALRFGPLFTYLQSNTEGSFIGSLSLIYVDQKRNQFSVTLSASFLAIIFRGKKVSEKNGFSSLDPPADATFQLAAATFLSV
jgi:hypothetical protein